MFFLKNKVLGIALCAVGLGMLLIILLPGWSLGLILAGLLFVVGLYLVKTCH